MVPDIKKSLFIQKFPVCKNPLPQIESAVGVNDPGKFQQRKFVFPAREIADQGQIFGCQKFFDLIVMDASFGTEYQIGKFLI